MMVQVRPFLARAVLGVCLCAVGCRNREQVEHYTVPRVEAPAAKDAMLGAIVTHDNQAWFFKISGPAEEVNKHADAFKTFIESLTFDAGKPTWTLPTGWREKESTVAAASGLERYRTLLVDGTPSLELAVTTFPTPKMEPDDFMLANVNRWRGQMSLPALSKDELPAQTASVSTKDGSATMVSLVGRLKASVPGRGPFMGGG